MSIDPNRAVFPTEKRGEHVPLAALLTTDRRHLEELAAERCLQGSRWRCDQAVRRGVSGRVERGAGSRLRRDAAHEPSQPQRGAAVANAVNRKSTCAARRPITRNAEALLQQCDT